MKVANKLGMEPVKLNYCNLEQLNKESRNELIRKIVDEVAQCSPQEFESIYAYAVSLIIKRYGH